MVERSDDYDSFQESLQETGGMLRVPADALLPGTGKRRKRSSIRRLFRGVFPCQGRSGEQECDHTTADSGTSSFLLFGHLHPCRKDGKDCPAVVPEIDSFSYLITDADGRSSDALDCASLPRAAVLGTGQYGIVWRARSRQSGQVYAVKSLYAERGLDVYQGKQEADAADQILAHPHPCLVRLFQVHRFDDGSLCTLVMEFCSGGDLQSRIRGCRVLAKRRLAEYAPPELSRMWVAQIFLGLAHLHLKVGILLRDLKPANVLISSAESAKLTDFGLSRVGMMATGQSFAFPAGTAGYIAPEVADCDGYGFQADLYSLGVLVWVLFTGGGDEGGCLAEDDDCEPRPPFNGGIDEDWDVLRRRRDEVKEESARDFVKALTERAAKTRLTHRDVRDHRFFSPDESRLKLPPLHAHAKAIAAWTESSIGRYRARLSTTLGDDASKLEDFFGQHSECLGQTSEVDARTAAGTAERASKLEDLFGKPSDEDIAFMEDANVARVKSEGAENRARYLASQDREDA